MGFPCVEIRTDNNSPIARGEMQHLNFGVVRHGERALRGFLVKNPTASSIRITRIGSDCECITLAPVPVSVDARSEVRIDATVDETRDDFFSGSLGVPVSAFSGGREVFRAEVDVVITK